MLPGTSRSSKLRRFLDVLDTVDGLDVVKLLSRGEARAASACSYEAPPSEFLQALGWSAANAHRGRAVASSSHAQALVRRRRGGSPRISPRQCAPFRQTAAFGREHARPRRGLRPQRAGGARLRRGSGKRGRGSGVRSAPLTAMRSTIAFLRRVQVQADDLDQLVLELGIAGQLERLNAMRLKTPRGPDPPHRRRRYNSPGCHRPVAPVRLRRGRLMQRQSHDLPGPPQTARGARGALA